MRTSPNNHSAESTPLLKYQLKRYEKIPLWIWDDPKLGSLQIANYIREQILKRQREGKHIVLGLATGSSPIRIYNELVRMHREEGLSFFNVITFNLDEYYPMQPEADQSYVRFMHEYLFKYIDIPQENINIPAGDIPMEEVDTFCEAYEKKIAEVGGIDIQLLGIGRTGHIGFNEPGSWKSSKTRLVKLDHVTRIDAVKSFGKEENVPYRAITMGVDTILKAKQIFVVAWGMHKADIVKKAVEGDISTRIPATFLQEHPNTKFYVDRAASEQLTKIKTPWLAGICNWDDALISKAVIWLSQKVKKPILKLTDDDYNIHGLSELIAEYNSSYQLNIQLFNKLQHTITGWPGGKPDADDTNRPERAEPAQKRVILFSPHPDDDVISMGGTLLRLVEQGHDVHVAYQVSGNIAVHDVDAWRHIEFLSEYINLHKVEHNDLLRSINETREQLPNNNIDLSVSKGKQLLQVKGLIRRQEAKSAALFCGVKEENIHFLDMPFYETGGVRKKRLSQVDIDIIKTLLSTIQPHQVYAAGDLADPHGTHRVCLEAVLESFRQTRGEPWWSDCYLWLYRGAWHEWPVDEIEMAVPLSPIELMKKRKAIFMHQSQKDQPVFPGDDLREFWQRAEDRNRETARLYDQLGLAEYEAMEAFVRYPLDKIGNDPLSI